MEIMQFGEGNYVGGMAVARVTRLKMSLKPCNDYAPRSSPIMDWGA